MAEPSATSDIILSRERCREQPGEEDEEGVRHFACLLACLLASRLRRLQAYKYTIISYQTALVVG